MSSSHSSHIQIRSFQPEDLEPIVELWNACLPKDRITVDRFWRLMLLDPNFHPDGAFIAEWMGHPVGFLLTIVRRAPMGICPLDTSVGYITAFFVEEKNRHRGIGRNLLQSGLAYLRGRGCRQVSCNGYAPYYVFPGVDVDCHEAQRLLEKSGFRAIADVVAMNLPLVGLTVPESAVARRKALSTEGIEVRRFERNDTLPLLKFAEDCFPYWHQSLIEGLQVNHGDVFVAVREREVLGFAQWQNPQTDPPNGAPGRFGPFGVHPDLRGSGIGSVLFHLVISEVTDRGAENLWFGWAGGRNLSFYERVGCQVTRRYRMFRVDLDEVNPP